MSFEKCLFKSFACVLPRIIAHRRRVLGILHASWIPSPEQMCDLQTLPPTQELTLHSVTMSCDGCKFFVLVKSLQRICFYFCCLCGWCHIREATADPKVTTLLPGLYTLSSSTSVFLALGVPFCPTSPMWCWRASRAPGTTSCEVWPLPDEEPWLPADLLLFSRQRVPFLSWFLDPEAQLGGPPHCRVSSRPCRASHLTAGCPGSQ